MTERMSGHFTLARRRTTSNAFDNAVGGRGCVPTGLKTSLLDSAGELMAKRVRTKTTFPCPPNELVDALAELVAPLRDFDRVLSRFPGVVLRGIVSTAPPFITRSRAGSPVDKKLQAQWTGFDLLVPLQSDPDIPHELPTTPTSKDSKSRAATGSIRSDPWHRGRDIGPRRREIRAASGVGPPPLPKGRDL